MSVVATFPLLPLAAAGGKLPMGSDAPFALLDDPGGAGIVRVKAAGQKVAVQFGLECICLADDRLRGLMSALLRLWRPPGRRRTPALLAPIEQARGIDEQKVACPHG